MKIKVLKTHPHGGRIRRQGDVYECDDKKARLLILIKKAEEFIEPPPKPVRKKAAVKKATPAKAQPAKEVPVVEEAPKYSTKVMTAED